MIIFIGSTIINENLHKVFNEIYQSQNMLAGINLFLLNLFIFISNGLIIFQDFISLVGKSSEGITLKLSNQVDEINFYNLIFVPLAWSLAVEIYFYFIAPFILTKKDSIIIFILFLFFFVKVSGFYISEDCNYENINNCFIKKEYSYLSFRFFPFVLFDFILGAYAYRNLSYLKEIFGKYTAQIGILIITSTLLCAGYLKNPLVASTTILIGFFVFDPSLWFASKDWKFDQFFADLSYPIYIFSFNCIFLSSYVVKNLGMGYGPYYFLIAYIIDIILSLIYLLIFNYAKSFYSSK